VSSLVMKLQLYVQQVNSALEDTSQQVLLSNCSGLHLFVFVFIPYCIGFVCN